jgi:hypothetical protein
MSMPHLYGRELKQYELLERVGSLGQVGGVSRVVLAEGNATGVEALEFRTGSGLDFTVYAGRGMDIGPATYREYPLAWMSPTGPAAAAFLEPEGLGWLRSFYGGLLLTCGLTYAGAPCTDGEEELGLHGRISHVAATNVCYGGTWEDNDYVMFAEGQVREASVFGPNVLLTRRISARLGERRLTVHDVVENQGFAPQEHMILYHCNLGYPLMDAATELVAPDASVQGRDEYSQETISRCASFSDPEPGIPERVYYHDLRANEDGSTMVALVNRGLGDGIALCFELSKNELPNVSQWKLPGQGTYVLGVEPGNCRVEGRVVERERGTLQVLEPGEIREYTMTIGIAEGKREIDDLLKAIKAIR